MSSRLFAAALVLLPYLPAGGAVIADFALGSHLSGAVVTVTRFGGPMSSATFIPSGTGAVATTSGSGGFTLTVSPGDTSLAIWTLTNTDPSLIFMNRIMAVSIDLTLSGLSLFDSGTMPSTPVSGPGIPGVVYLSGVAIGGSANLLPWADASNLGDMYHAVDFTLLDGGLSAGLSTSWSADTDLIGIPEPGGAALSGIGILLLAMRSLAARRRGA